MSKRVAPGARAPGYPAFDRRFFESHEDFTVIGTGAIGGKASGLALIKGLLESRWPAADHPAFEIGIPRLTVIATGVFDRFMEENRLWDVVRSEPGDAHVAAAFQRAHLPAGIVGDLRALVERVRQPLAVRSSSLLEDAPDFPHAGLYATKMLPNHRIDAESRFRRLTEAIKLVYASTYFAGARQGLPVDEHRAREKMAVVIQEVVGRRHGDRFYPDVSGVARSWNFYAAGVARPEEGIASLALGLGRTIVEGGTAWHYSPAHPRSMPPASARELLKRTQTRFWAVNMGNPPSYDPVAETEYLLESGLPEAEEDGVLSPLASTYDAGSDRLSPGTGATGARVLTFAPMLLLESPPLNAAIVDMLRMAEDALASPVEIEFALTLDPARTPPARIGFLQARPLRVTGEHVELPAAALEAPGVVVASEAVLGRGAREQIADIVYVRPQGFDLAQSRRMAAEIEERNHVLVAEGRPYVLIGIGRWGTSDPWLGVPVRWEQISGARAIVEASLPQAQPEPSQGSHFFHNLVSLGVSYFTVRHTGRYGIDWDWLDSRASVAETALVRHVRVEPPLHVEVDGHAGRGVVRRTMGTAGGTGS